jgi:hypothetical protein
MYDTTKAERVPSTALITQNRPDQIALRRGKPMATMRGGVGGTSNREDSAKAAVAEQISQAVQSTSNLLHLMQQSSPAQVSPLSFLIQFYPSPVGPELEKALAYSLAFELHAMTPSLVHIRFLTLLTDTFIM